MAAMHPTPHTPRRNPLRPWIWGGAACLLLLPALAMLARVDGVDWSAIDFVVMGAMLATACGLYELGARMGGGRAYRAGFGLAVLTGFLTVWVNLAVGMLGDEGDPANLVFAGVLLVAVAGSLAARFRAGGMAAAMGAAATAQLLAAGAGVALGYQPLETTLGACFAAPWALSALLFRLAAGASPVRPG